VVKKNPKLFFSISEKKEKKYIPMYFIEFIPYKLIHNILLEKLKDIRKMLTLFQIFQNVYKKWIYF